MIKLPSGTPPTQEKIFHQKEGNRKSRDFGGNT